MRAGELTERVEILAPADDAPVRGVRGKVRWESRGIWYAQVKTRQEHRVYEAGEYFADQCATVLTRLSVPARPGWRLRHIGGDCIYSIATVTPARRPGIKYLTCEKINE